SDYVFHNCATVFPQRKEFIDILRERRHKRRQRRARAHVSRAGRGRTEQKGCARKKVEKGTRGMPRLPEAMKDAASCDKPWGSANANRSTGFRMGQPAVQEARHSA